MSTVELRAEVENLLKQIDGSFLKVVHSMLETYLKEQEDQVSGYQLDGKPITVQELKEDIKVSEEQYRKGQYLSIEELDEKSKKWLKPTK